MKIAFLVGGFPNFSETFILNQIIWLMDKGHDVHIFAHKPKRITKTHDEYKNYNLSCKTYYYPLMPRNYVFRAIKMFYILATKALQKRGLILKTLRFKKYGRFSRSLRLFYMAIPFLRIQDTQYDVIHCHHGNSGMVSVLLREIGAISGPILTTFHGFDINVIPQQFGLNIYDFLFAAGDLFTVNSDFTSRKVKQLGCPQRKIRKLPVGINLSDYSFHQKRQNNSDPIRILTVGRLVEKKGIEFALKAISKVIVNYPNILYRIVGDGELKNPLLQLANDLNILNNVHFLGWKTQTEIKDIYNDSDIFMLVSVTAQNGDQEGQGLVLQEAQAIGLPVIATHHNGFPESVLDGESAYLVPEKDVDSIVLCLEKLLSSPEKWTKMGIAGRQFVEANFDHNMLNTKLLSFYKTLAK